MYLMWTVRRHELIAVRENKSGAFMLTFEV